MHGHFMHENREIPEPSRKPQDVGKESMDRSAKASGRTADTHGPGKSDRRIVPKKPANNGEAKAAPAESAEGRGLTKRNALQTAAPRTPSRTRASNGLQRVRDAARKDKETRFTALLHHVTPDLLRRSFYALKRDAAPGVDGLTWRAYEKDLATRLTDLHGRVHRGAYRAQPSRRTYIPKTDGRQRPLGIASLEDKIVQQATVTVLNHIYEEDFLGFSYGFRPNRSQHDALDALWVGITNRKVNWVLDADIQGFFDSLSHEWLTKFVEHRIADPRVLRLIRKWLRAGVHEDGKRMRTTKGTPQGAVISPLLGNIYLHYVLDLWVQHWRRRHARGDVVIVRYADDFAMGFQHKHEAEQFLRDLHDRLRKFGLTLHPDKTRLIEFGRFAGSNRRRRNQGRPETFDFLGFTHACSTRRKDGGFTVRRQTMSKRLRAKLREIKDMLKRRRHAPMPEVGARLKRTLSGYYNYHAVPGNGPTLDTFRTQVIRMWMRTLRRRSHKHRLTWKRFAALVQRWIPRPRIRHPYPNVRFYAKYSR